MNGLVAKTVATLVRPLARRVRVMLGRCVLEAIVDTGQMQTVKLQALDGIVRDDVEHYQPGGLSHVTPKDSEALFLSVGGDSSHMIAILASDRTKRPTGLSSGETKLYAVDGGYIYLKQDGSVAIVQGDGALTHIGAESAAEFAAQANKTDSRIGALETAFNNHVTNFNALLAEYKAHNQASTATFQPLPAANGGQPVTVGPPVSAVLPSLTVTPGSSVAASKVKVE